MKQKLCLFDFDLLMSIEIKLRPVAVFDVFLNEDGTQSARNKKHSTRTDRPAYRIRVRARELSVSL